MEEKAVEGVQRRPGLPPLALRFFSFLRYHRRMNGVLRFRVDDAVLCYAGENTRPNKGRTRREKIAQSGGWQRGTIVQLW